MRQQTVARPSRVGTAVTKKHHHIVMSLLSGDAQRALPTAVPPSVNVSAALFQERNNPHVALEGGSPQRSGTKSVGKVDGGTCVEQKPNVCLAAAVGGEPQWAGALRQQIDRRPL